MSRGPAVPPTVYLETNRWYSILRSHQLEVIVPYFCNDLTLEQNCAGIPLEDQRVALRRTSNAMKREATQFASYEDPIGSYPPRYGSLR